MKRSEINNIILEANEMIKSFGHHLPDFAYWSVEKFREKQEDAKEIIRAGCGWDITDYGRGNFQTTGLFLFTLRNGKIADLASGKGMCYAEKLLISSFNHHWLQAIALKWPEVKIGALSASYELDCTASARTLNAYSVNIALDAVDKQFVQTAQQDGFDVFVYTVDEPRDMLMLNEWGVTGIFTNVPDVALSVLSH